MQLKTAGDLRGFLADVLVGIRNGDVDANQANAISKVAAQINSSLATEVQARIHLKTLGSDEAAGAMVIATQQDPVARAIPQAPPQPVQKVQELPAQPVTALVRSLDDATANFRRNQDDGEKVWCDQCDMRVTTSQAVSCKSRHCKAKEAA